MQSGILLSNPAATLNRTRGHAETPFIIGFGSLLFGLVWATILCARHEELALWRKIAVFAISPVVGLFVVLVMVAFILCAGLVGDWLESEVANHRKTRKS